MTSPLIELDAIAAACRPLAQCLMAASLGRQPPADELAAALDALAAARTAPGRVGWAVRRILDGVAAGPLFDGAADIILKVAGYYPSLHDGSRSVSTPTPRSRRPRRRPPPAAPNQPSLPGF
jgi:hypothetical protein